MATTQGWAPTGASPVHALEGSPYLAPLDQTGSPNNDLADLAQESLIHADVAPPNPPFIFPTQLPSPSSAPASYSRASGRRPMSAIELHSTTPGTTPESGDRPRRTIALPAFSFNPGASLPGADSMTLLSPPITPNSARPIPSPSRPHGHRRGGSEFVGGSIRDGNSIAVMSTSPTRSESGFASPGLAPPPKRGHRRGVSSTISTNDLPILRPLPDFGMPKGSSAPNSPTAVDSREWTPIPIHDQSPNLPEPAHALEETKCPSDPFPDAAIPATPATPSSDVESSSPRQVRPARARVGFSDKLEFIPRPLSLVSSDASSTATARPGHSVSGSISSIVSAASPGGRESPAHLPRSPTRDLSDSRPSTAGAILERGPDLEAGNAPNMSPKRRNSIPTLLNVAEAQASSPANPTARTIKTPKRWSFFGLEPPFINSAAPPKRRPSSSSSSESVSRAISGGSSSGHESDSTETGREAPACVKKPNKKTSKKTSKKKKVKGWAGSILPRKPRGHKKRSKMSEVRPPTPPASVSPCDDEGEEEEADGADIPDPELPAVKITLVDSPTIAQDAASPQSRSRDDASQPMIDLDAALGPFNTPLPHNAEWEAAQRAAGNTGKRRLHSAQGLKGFSGPGMHYHRRAESAPDLPPFDAGRAGIHRFGSNPTMADVFEEDEEEDEEDAAASNQSDAATTTEHEEDDSDDGEVTPPATVLPVEIPPTVEPSPFEMIPTPRRTSSGPSEADRSVAHSIRAECSKTSLQEEVIVEEAPSIIFRNAGAFNGGSDSAASSPRKLYGAKELPPMEAANPAYLSNAAAIPISPYAASHASSSHPSPRSPMSIDAQRISTAPSSVTDANSFQSLLMGEPGPEVRISMDYDIPSLTSSNSTMTRDSAFIPNPRMSQPNLRKQRPVSVSSAAFGRRRSSLVSLSRLISSSHGERSKLSMEVTLDNESENKRSRSRGSKTKKRLGRMMQFWKPNKDGAST
ncbi:Uncharacterized protein TCAP_00471 [Tolypocladium capitatum]|uniref:Cell wall proline rich protein n=1 Tax=Tolypocladium capitatum TaxID=45235 RepID=A0A2K3QPZ9_9HYPO|nr:Uncharacterized protein TCAP_00471 [Tolypocladium capitatum]